MKIVELILDENQEESGIEAISIVESPAIEEDFIALKSNEIKLAEIDKEKKILMGALLIPNKPIYRNNGEDEYYIYFSKDTVLKASQMYLTKGNQNNSTLEHQHSLSGLSLVESWLVEDEVHDKSRKYGMNVPVGTWMGAVKVNNDEVWNDYVKTGKVKGFSIEGYFADKMERPKESIKEDMSEQNADLLLSQIEKIVKGEKVELALDIREIKQRAANSQSVYKQSINQSNKAIQRVANDIKQDVNIIEFNEKEVLKGFSELKSKAKEIGIDINKTKIGSAIEQSLKIIEKSKKQTIALFNKIKKNKHITMSKHINKIFSMIQTELKSEKVELSLLSDAQSTADKLDGLFGDANRSFNIEGNKMLDRIMPIIKDFNKTRQELIKQSSNFESKAESIGIDRKSIDNSLRKINQSLKMGKKLSEEIDVRVKAVRRAIF